ncbi:MAG: cyclic di-GMP phosphodiesterase, partial [Abditibacteriota bacterium]|nr:cyclic di-GMP phosphodiesterase [Abditibacteriota bacterium]
IARLARAGEQHDDETGKHTVRVAVTAGLIAQALGLGADRIEIIQRAAPLHDVGKIGVSDSILLKPGRLTEEEFRCMQQHSKIGSELLSGGRSEIVQLAECIALNHHEKWNGCGYPQGLEGENIPIEGRIVAVADVFDALTHERPYKKAWSIDDAKNEISRQAGQQFDPKVVASFLQLPHQELV